MLSWWTNLCQTIVAEWIIIPSAQPLATQTASCTPKKQPAQWFLYFYKNQSPKTKTDQLMNREKLEQDKSSVAWNSCLARVTTNQQRGKEWPSCRRNMLPSMTHLLITAPMLYREGTASYAHVPELSPSFHYAINVWVLCFRLCWAWAGWSLETN